jgi:hypothetical protein
MIEDCKKSLEDSINTFKTNLNTINQSGGEGEIVEAEVNFNVPKYKQEFVIIKRRYEKELKENIKSYKDICSALTNENNGLVPTVINSLRTIINKERKINKKFKINLNSIFHDENPFAENKTAFNALKNEINAAKRELSGSPSISPSTVVPLVNSNLGYDYDSDDSSDSGTTSDSEYTDSGDPELATLPLLQQTSIDNLKIDGYEREIKNMTKENWISKKNDPLYSDAIAGLMKGMGKSDKFNLDGDTFNITEFNEKAINIMKQELNIEKGSPPMRQDLIQAFREKTSGCYKKKSKSKKMTSKKTSMKVVKKTSSKAKENKNKNKKIVKSYSKSKSKKQSGGFIRGGVLFPQDFYDTSTVM